jgi:hypothetical protein
VSEPATTHFSDRCNILADLWLNYRADEEFKDFLDYNDIGLPLAYMIANGIVQSTTMSENFINETFDLLLASLGIEDLGYTSLDEMFDL